MHTQRWSGQKIKALSASVAASGIKTLDSDACKLASPTTLTVCTYLHQHAA